MMSVERKKMNTLFNLYNDGKISKVNMVVGLGFVNKFFREFEATNRARGIVMVTFQDVRDYALKGLEYGIKISDEEMLESIHVLKKCKLFSVQLTAKNIEPNLDTAVFFETHSFTEYEFCR